MSLPLTDSALIERSASTIYEAFNTYRFRFKEITRRAKLRFDNRDWQGMRSDAAERLDLYSTVVDRIESDMRRLLADRVREIQLWPDIKTAYSDKLVGNNDWELAETFFNSITRRIFATEGVDPEIEFVNTDFETPPNYTFSTVFNTYKNSNSTTDLIRRILADCQLTAPFQNIERDAKAVASRIKEHLNQEGAAPIIDRIEIARSVFFRGTGAYLVGRIYAGSNLVPLAIALLNLADGLAVDAVLIREADVSILFSFTRSYFHVEVERPYDLIQFIRTILPHKRIAELYISLGFNKHGKTELYRELLDHLSVCYEDRFDISPGRPGMVMLVFNMPKDDIVFKMIRDRFDTPKHTSRQEVMEKYEMVFRHDRAGRLVEAQEFEHLKFDACCFSEPLLTELRQTAGQMVRIEGDQIIVAHAYVERRVMPLDVFLNKADDSEAERVAVDWGQAIKDLAVSNIFPGDILLKNFGVTRHGRVVFYDYDELSPLTSCRFRKLPPSSSYADEMAAEPWFYVDENDVFPEEFRRFLGLPGQVREVFLQHHADLFEVDFWRHAQQAIEAGELPPIFPYADSCRIKRR
ncbi:MAG: bifunctional isocitrate dehydrogenase kinase/phosphatase [Desulfobacterales bacterium]|jgi:isocitrate dehydrogenase kinase/phosphatase